MFCSNCGKEIKDDAKFCKYCGATGQKRFLEEAHTSIKANEKNKRMSKKGIVFGTAIVVSIIATFIVIVFLIMSRETRNNVAEELQVGDVITFGTYEQDNKKENGTEEIKWIVLAKEGDRILLISKYGIDCKPYHEANQDITWEECSLREWLNSGFLDVAFTDEEKAMIKEAVLSANKHITYSTDSNSNIKDKIFLLTMTEAREYFDDDYERKCVPTEYAVEKGTYKSSGYNGCSWWLCTPNSYKNEAVSVALPGQVNTSGVDVDYYGFAVRPAMWVSF